MAHLIGGTSVCVCVSQRGGTEDISRLETRGSLKKRKNKKKIFLLDRTDPRAAERWIGAIEAAHLIPHVCVCVCVCLKVSVFLCERTRRWASERPAAGGGTAAGDL